MKETTSLDNSCYQFTFPSAIRKQDVLFHSEGDLFDSGMARFSEGAGQRLSNPVFVDRAAAERVFARGKAGMQYSPVRFGKANGPDRRLPGF